MKVVGLDGREYSFTPSNKQSNVNRRSKLHERAYELLREIYPFANILQEVTLPGSRTGMTGILHADFFLPVQRIVVEAHGQQHYEFTPHFHESKKQFLLSKARDNKKKEWCELNNIQYIVFPYDEDEEEWRKRL